MKKILSLIILAALIFSSISLVLANAFDYEIGDVNGDGKIDQYDYILVKRHYFNTRKLSAAEMTRADVNYDGEVNQYDYILLCRHYFGTYKIIQPENGGDGDVSGGIGDEDIPEIDIPAFVEIPNIVSMGKRYETTPAASANYEDTYNSELTDGLYNKGSGYSAAVFSGYSSNFDVVVDLGDDGEDLYLFEVSVLSTDEAGINLPSQIVAYGSNDKGSWQKIGNLTIPQFKDSTVLTASLEISNAVDYRYVKFSVTKKAAWVFIDEVLIHSSIPKYDPSVLGRVQEQYYDSHKYDSTYQTNRDSVKSDMVYSAANGRYAISKKCDYTIDCSGGYDWRTGENIGFLTDGTAAGSAYEREVWVGIEASKKFSITIDLGSIRDDVFGFALHAFNRPMSNINLPYYIDVLVSEDGQRFVNIGRCYAADTDQENYSYYLNLATCINARYVKFNVSAGEGYVWFEEVEVYANTTVDESFESVYGDFDFVTTKTPSYWEKGSDYNTVQNLILGKPQQITTDDFVEASNDPKGNTSENTTLLTDGKVTYNDSCYNAPWVHFVYGSGRSIYYDLGNISSVSSFSVRFLYYTDWAIYLPSNLQLLLSEDGENWYRAANINPKATNSSFITIEYDLDKEYRARYAKVYMRFGGHVFLDEITINGKKNLSGASDLTSLTKIENASGSNLTSGFAAPSEDLLGGVKDVCLIYHNYITTNEAFFKPYVGYVDKNGEVVDTMFDGYLFLPSTGVLPSGGRPYGTNYASDWDSLFDELFRKGINFDALNKTAETTKAKLGLSELKLKVYVTIPHMDDTLYYFGDIDHDGKNDPLTTLEGRVYVAKAYAERVIEKFNSMGYQNLELYGFYWFHEEISGSDVETAIAVNAMFDELDYQLFWIPYYNADGYSRWEEFGFDVCCYQPNYAFSIAVEESRIPSAVNAALTYGMCIEMEIDGAVFGDERFFKKYMDYLRYGDTLGYMKDAIHMYYQGLDYFGRASRSEDALTRLIYEYTYDFIKGKLDITPDAREELSFKGKKNGMLMGTLANEGDDIVMFRTSVSPEHGTLTLTDDGQFVYYPNFGFTGVDTFTYQISHQLGWSEECTVTIKVE